MNLVDNLKEDLFITLIEHYKYSQEEAEELWRLEGEQYLDNVFNDITARITEMME